MKVDVGIDRDVMADITSSIGVTKGAINCLIQIL